MDFGIPPATYSHREALAIALHAQRRLVLPEHVIGLHGAEAIAAYLNKLGLRKRPFTAASVRLWRKTRRFPVIALGPKKYMTTNLHVFAWLCTFKQYKPKAAAHA